MILYGVRVIRYDILIRYFLNLFVCLIIVIIFKNSKTFSKIKLSPFPVSFKDILAFFHLCFPIFMFFFCVGGAGTLREKCLYSEFFWYIFSLIWTEHGEILRISPYPVWMREKTDQKNFEYGHFSCIGNLKFDQH